MKTKTLPKLQADAQKVFNAWVRRRDNGLPCISCGKPGNQAGHYLSVKQFPCVRYNIFNCNLQCSWCNLYCHGNQVMYRRGLTKRFGEEVVIDLENYAIKNRLWKWSRTELEEIIKKYK